MGTLGLDDSVSPQNTQSPIQVLRCGSYADKCIGKKNRKNFVNIRLVTGDHLDTAMVVAKKAKIIGVHDDEINCAMLGCEFEEYVRGVGLSINNDDEIVIEQQAKQPLMELISNLRVIALCEPIHKRMLVAVL